MYECWFMLHERLINVLWIIYGRFYGIARRSPFKYSVTHHSNVYCSAHHIAAPGFLLVVTAGSSNIWVSSTMSSFATLQSNMLTSNFSWAIFWQYGPFYFQRNYVTIDAAVHQSREGKTEGKRHEEGTFSLWWTLPPSISKMFFSEIHQLKRKFYLSSERAPLTGPCLLHRGPISISEPISSCECTPDAT